MAAGLRAFGVREEDIAASQQRAVPAETDFEVHADCWDSVVFFMGLRTQWIYVSVTVATGMTVQRQGLDYGRVESALRLAGIRRALWPSLFADLQVMEDAVLEVDVEKLTK